MSEPILIYIDGHTYANQMPVDFATDDTKAWVQAFEYAVKYIAPYGVSFVLLGRGCRVDFPGGIPVKNDIDRLCQQLREYEDATALVASSLLAAA